jgi:hypothetical protein
VKFERGERPRMFLFSMADYFDVVIDNILSFLDQDGYYIGSCAGRNRYQQHLDRCRSSPSITFSINYLCVSAWRRSDKHLIARPSNGRFIWLGIH